MSLFNANAIAIMLKPLLSKWIEPMEQDGTLDKLADDVKMLAAQGAIPALAEIVINMKEHNQLLEQLLNRIKENEIEAFAYPRTTGLVRDHRDGMSQPDGTD